MNTLLLMARRARGRVRRAISGDRGEVIPTAILWPFAILVTFIGVQVMILHQAKDHARAAAQQAAYAEAAYGATPGVGYTVADTWLAPDGNLIHDQNVTITRTATDVRVTITGTVYGWLNLPFDISQDGYASIERFTTEATP